MPGSRGYAIAVGCHSRGSIRYRRGRIPARLITYTPPYPSYEAVDAALDFVGTLSGRVKDTTLPRRPGLRPSAAASCAPRLVLPLQPGVASAPLSVSAAECPPCEDTPALSVLRGCYSASRSRRSAISSTHSGCHPGGVGYSRRSRDRAMCARSAPSSTPADTSLRSRSNCWSRWAWR